MKSFLSLVADGKVLSEDEAETAFTIIMEGDATPAQLGAFLLALRVRGEGISEITGAARALRKKALFVKAPDNAIDIVGTGGDGTGTYNISTAAALVVAGCGIPVAKHGNKALSSKSGSADVLTALGVNNEASFELIEESIREAGIGFLMAPRHHSAMRHVAGPRVELATRTIFNVLGPLCNPSNIHYQLTGVYSQHLLIPIAQTLKNLGCKRTWVVHGSDGSDEITTTGITYVSSLENGVVTNFELSPSEAGLPLAKIGDLKGGDALYNANAIQDLLAGQKGPYRDVVLLNAAAALIISGQTSNLKDAIILCEKSIDNGKAKEALDKMISITNKDNDTSNEEEEGL